MPGLDLTQMFKIENLVQQYKMDTLKILPVLARPLKPVNVTMGNLRRVQNVRCTIREIVSVAILDTVDMSLLWQV